VVKVRKPYTITKQRERWTEEEHGLFLEALNKYGRKWCKISDHIGTKTAVQIRSHAQKFFSRVEREKQSGNLLVEEVHIPPPRPKKKTPHPYPRKATTTSAVVDNAAPSTSTKEATPPPSGEQQLADTSLATVAAAASAAAAVAAVAVVVAAGQDVQAQLRVNCLTGYDAPLFEQLPVITISAHAPRGLPLLLPLPGKSVIPGPLHKTGSATCCDRAGIPASRLSILWISAARA